MGFPQNTYPNFTNFHEVSFPEGVIPPDVDPDVDTMCVRYNPAWAKVLAAACGQLTQLATWTGTDDEKKLAVNRATNLKIQLQEFEECDMSGCCYDVVEHRVTSDGELQIRINGGDWIPDPDDPRKTGTALPPPVMDETHTKCDAATNGKQHIVDYIGSVSSELGGAGAVLEVAFAVAALIVALFFGQVEAIPIIVPLIISLIPSLVFLGQAAWDAYWDSTAEDIILCALYCTIGDDGTFDDTQFAAFLSKLGSDLTAGVAADNLIGQLRAAGVVALNNMCSYGESAEADCSSCECGCVAGWVTGTMVDGNTIAFADIYTLGDYVYIPVTYFDGSHYYGQAHKSDPADCCTCFVDSEDGGFVSGGANQQAAVYLCGDGNNTTYPSSAFSFGLFGTGDGTNCWLVQMRCDEPSLFRFRPT